MAHAHVTEKEMEKYLQDYGTWPEPDDYDGMATFAAKVKDGKLTQGTDEDDISFAEARIVDIEACLSKSKRKAIEKASPHDEQQAACWIYCEACEAFMHLKNADFYAVVQELCEKVNAYIDFINDCATEDVTEDAT